MIRRAAPTPIITARRAQPVRELSATWSDSTLPFVAWMRVPGSRDHKTPIKIAVVDSKNRRDTLSLAIYDSAGYYVERSAKPPESELDLAPGVYSVVLRKVGEDGSTELIPQLYERLLLSG